MVAMLGKTTLFGAAYSTLLVSYMYKPSPPAQPSGRSGSAILLLVVATQSTTHVHSISQGLVSELLDLAMLLWTSYGLLL